MSGKYFCITLGLLIALIACRSEKDVETESMHQGSMEGSSASAGNLPQLTDDFYVELYEAQEMIKIFQDEKSFRESYCNKAYFKDYNLFISMGIGVLKNPQTGQPIPRHLAQRAATLDARRWAAYGEAWLKNDYEPPFGKMESYVNHPVRTISENIVGDSLFVFMATSLAQP